MLNNNVSTEKSGLGFSTIGNSINTTARPWYNTGFTCGSFDLLHVGHTHFFYECKKLCGKLMVGLQTNPSIDRKWKNAPVQSVFERFVQLRNCTWVDEIIPYETEHDLENLLSMMPINARFLGSDYLNKEFTGKAICNKRGIAIEFIDRLHSYSSSELRKRVWENEQGSNSGS